MIAPVMVIMLVVQSAQSTVLDPALYLSPGPPLTAGDNAPPGRVGTAAVNAPTERNSKILTRHCETNDKAAPVPAAVGRMFWPRFSSPQPTLGIHIPLTFSLSGSYGKVPVTGAVTNTYASVAGLGSNLLGKTALVSGYGRSALAGSSYGSYGSGAMRVYGGDNTAAWSGWGNGKWGHYGKG